MLTCSLSYQTSLFHQGDFLLKILRAVINSQFLQLFQNIGISNSTRSHISFYLSTTSTITNGVCVGCVSVEALAAGGSSESKQITIPMPAAITSGAYFVGWVVDPYDEVSESDENNGFYLSSTQLVISNSITFSRHIPYPIIFIHGLISNDKTWSTFLSQLDCIRLVLWWENGLLLKLRWKFTHIQFN